MEKKTSEYRFDSKRRLVVVDETQLVDAGDLLVINLGDVEFDEFEAAFRRYHAARIRFDHVTNVSWACDQCSPQGDCRFEHYRLCDDAERELNASLEALQRYRATALSRIANSD